VPLTGTFTKVNTLLSFESDLAVEYAQHWLKSAGSLHPPASGVIRRALVVYMHHLTTADRRDEVGAVRRACTASDIDADRQRMALLRLYACPPGEPLPPFRDILRSPAEARQMAELTDRAEALADACMRERPMRRAATPPHSTTARTVDRAPSRTTT
jgi:hypothetical protein